MYGSPMFYSIQYSKRRYNIGGLIGPKESPTSVELISFRNYPGPKWRDIKEVSRTIPSLVSLSLILILPPATGLQPQAYSTSPCQIPLLSSRVKEKGTAKRSPPSTAMRSSW